MKDLGKDDGIIFQKCIYGPVQAETQYNKKAVEILKELGFTMNNTEPWLFMKHSTKDIVYVLLYTDNNLMVVNTEAIDEVMRLH